MSDSPYLHGTSAREQQRLIEQAERLGALLDANLILEPGERLLEIGCGVGAVLARIARLEPEAELCGIDISPEQITAAQRHLAAQGLAGITLRVGDAAALPWGNSHFDRVRLVWVMEHLQDPVAVLQEARRVLRPGGTIHLTETDYSSLRVTPPDRTIETFLAAFVAHFDRHGDAHAGPQLGPWLERAGFGEVAVKMIGVHHWCPGQRQELQAFCSYLLQFIEPELEALLAQAACAEEREQIRCGLERFRQLAENADASISICAYQGRGSAPDWGLHPVAQP